MQKILKIKNKTVILSTITVLLVVGLYFAFLYRGHEKSDHPVTGAEEAFIPDPVPAPIEQVDCLAGQFRQEAVRGGELGFAVKTAAAADLPRFGQLPRGISGEIRAGDPGQALVNLSIGEDTAPGDYSLPISYGQNEAGAERLCQFNLIIQ